MQTIDGIDLFAGGGGSSLGATRAGIRIVWAGNHWPLAVASHKLNHPDAEHVCQDLQQADWAEVPEHRVLIGSPCCYGNSPAARGPRKKNPKVRARHAKLRATAMAMLTAADACEPEAVIVENVPQFRDWRLYRSWRTGLEDLGYLVQEVVLTATDFGVPQRRTRLFVVATRRPVDLRFERRPEPAFGPCIEWDADVPWTPVRQATPSVQQRIARSRPRWGDRFLTQHTRDHHGTPLHEPIRTITTADQWALVDGDRYRPLTVRENMRAMGFPDDYVLLGTRSEQIEMAGHAVPPAMMTAVCERVCTEALC